MFLFSYLFLFILATSFLKLLSFGNKKKSGARGGDLRTPIPIDP